MVSGAEILGYKGDAALAGGLNKTPEGTGADSLNLFNQTMTNAANQRFQFDVQRYQQGIKDRDAILNLVSENADVTKGIDLLDSDKKILQDKLKDVNENVINNVRKYGNIKSNLSAYADVQKKINDYQQAAQSAKTRAIAGKELLTAAAKETNAVDRAAMLKHYQDQLVDKGVDHLPEPYFQRFKYDPNLLAPDVKEETLGKKYDGDYEVITKGTPFAPFRYNKDAIATGTDSAKNLIQHQQTLYNDALNSGTLTPDYVKQVNAKLDQFNSAGGFKPGDVDYASHIGEVGEDGQITNLTKSPQDFATALHILGKFKQQVDKNISKDVRELKDSQAEREQKRASAALSLSGAAENYEQIKDLKATREARIEKIKSESETLRQKGDATGATANGYAAEVLDLVNNNINKKPTTLITEAQKQKLGFSKDAEFIQLPKNETIKRIGTLPDYGENNEKETLKGRNFPAAGYLVKDNGKYTFVFPATKDGRQIDIGEAKKVSLGGAVEEILKYNNSYTNLSDKDNVAAGLGYKVVEDALAADTPQQSNAPATSNIIPRAQVSEDQLRQGTNGVELNVNGQWRKVKGKDKAGNIVLE